MIFLTEHSAQGQFDQVIREEVPKILDACKRIGGDKPYRPQLTVVICGKRHHARFPATRTDDADRKGNTLPGTVQDKGIGDIYAFSFYLQVSNATYLGLDGIIDDVRKGPCWSARHCKTDALHRRV